VALLPAVKCPPHIPQWLCQIAPNPVLRALAVIEAHQNVVHLVELAACIGEAYADPVAGEVCFKTLFADLAWERFRRQLEEIGRWLRRRRTQHQIQEEQEMACVTTHSGPRVQGPGLCCQAVATGALTPPPPGTTLPQYIPGMAKTLPAGRITQVTDAAGHCASCMIVGSSSRKNPGAPVLKFIRGGPSCPSTMHGCCYVGAGGTQLSI
jgi:hypothetical protein